MSGGAVSETLASAIEIQDVHVIYQGDVTAVRGVSLACPVGTVTVILGPNGAGKTSLTRAISGFLPSEGVRVTATKAEFGGDSILGATPDVLVRRGLAYVPERVKVFASMTVEENLRLACRRQDFTHRRDDAVALFAPLARLMGTRAGLLSGGERQMLALARAIMSEPRLLVVDELSLGLAPALTESLLQAVARINKDHGMTILLVEQAARAALAVADHALVMRHGEVTWRGPASELASESAFERVYLDGPGDEA